MTAYIPKTGRQCAKKTFYVFFNVGSEYEGKYAEVRASSFMKAEIKAYEEYGQAVSSITPSKEYADSKIKLYQLEEVKACTR